MKSFFINIFCIIWFVGFMSLALHMATHNNTKPQKDRIEELEKRVIELQKIVSILAKDR